MIHLVTYLKSARYELYTKNTVISEVWEGNPLVAFYELKKRITDKKVDCVLLNIQKIDLDCFGEDERESLEGVLSGIVSL